METLGIPKDTVAMFRLPLAISQMTAICHCYAKGHVITQQGEWVLVIKKEGKPS